MQIPFKMNDEILLLFHTDSVSISSINYDEVMSFVQMSFQPNIYL